MPAIPLYLPTPCNTSYSGRPNSSNVYMHDTLAQEFFAKSRRDFSHGRIRLEKPADLAVWVLHENPGWDMDGIRATTNGTPNQQVNLAHPMPVLILFGSVILTEDGIVHFYDDIYGHDAAPEKALAKVFRTGLIASDEAGRAVETPLANATYVQVDEVRMRIVAYTAASQSESSFAQFERVDAGHPQIDGFRLNVKAVLCDSGGVRAERFVRRRGAIAADDVDLAAWAADRCGEIREDIV
jgi:hypothetical protein